jgi:hypothetical protein
MWVPAYVSGELLLSAYLCSRIVLYSIDHGMCEEAMIGCLVHGFFLVPFVEDFTNSYEFGSLAIVLVDNR